METVHILTVCAPIVRFRRSTQSCSGKIQVKDEVEKVLMRGELLSLERSVMDECRMLLKVVRFRYSFQRAHLIVEKN
jgi:hypothetical protein